MPILVGTGAPQTVIRFDAEFTNGIWTRETEVVDGDTVPVETEIAVLGDLLPWRDDRRTDFPQGFRKEGARVLHLARGQSELRTFSALSQVPADEIEVTLDGVETRMVCIAKLDHVGSTPGLSLLVDHRRYLFAIPEKQLDGDSLTGTLLQ